MVRKVLIALACVLPGASAGAQVAEALQPPAPVSDAACELHVWPAGDIKAVTQGWVLNNTVNQDFNLAKGGFAKPQTLTPDRQVALLKAIDLPGLLKLPAQQVVTHNEPLTRAQAAAQTRNAPSTSPCYTEFVVSQLFYDRAPIAGKSLKTMIVYRTFGDAAEVQATFATWAETGLVIFPAKTPEQAGAAEAELESAYQTNMREFASYAIKPKKQKKRRN